MKCRAVFSGILSAAVLIAADTGELLYRTHCAPCHGLQGEGGKGPALSVQSLPRAATDAALSAIITTGISGTGMPATRMTQTENTDLVAYVRKLGSVAPDRVSGNVSNGKDLFRGKGGCMQCHRVAGEGGISGPDLTMIGLRRGASHLTRSLLEPSAEVPDNFNVYRKVIALPDNYLFVSVETSDGKKFSGIRLNEDTFSIQLRDSSDRLRSFRKSDLGKLDKRWNYSPMPSYAGVFTVEEIRDIVSYLSSLRGAS